jgi:nucleoid-associated protein YgaU
VVAAGESLYKIAQRYYGNGTRWPEILEANRDQLQNERAVRAGMELRIP